MRQYQLTSFELVIYREQVLKQPIEASLLTLNKKELNLVGLFIDVVTLMVLLRELAMCASFAIKLAECSVHKVGFITLINKFTEWNDPCL